MNLNASVLKNGHKWMSADTYQSAVVSGICVTRRTLFRYSRFRPLHISLYVLFVRFEFRAGMGFTVLSSPDIEFTDFLLYYDIVVEFRGF